MFKQEYLEVFINDANRVTIKSGDNKTPDLVSIDPQDLEKLAHSLMLARIELINRGELEQ